ncbi:hypothetical protein BDV96DRAFT_655287 [Lophiotrema nucula]|uniref:Uncharacterized protein n=1 Tax=Lophiotrema nucula TaxID=690887 RepID=A0A6A5YFI2_9PLEO|nr:hypothetical protein BDV96DRAFT_655287 [Lophiotrema nucula]
MTTPKLDYHFTLRGYTTISLLLPSIKSGPTRLIASVTHGFLSGKGLEAEILPGGADWSLVDQTSKISHLNVRVQAKLPNGKGVYIQYRGVLHIDVAAEKILSGDTEAQTTEFGEHTWFVTPRFETNSEEWKWIENEVWVGQGRLVVDGEGEGGGRAVEYRIFRVVN